jgi:hypothetical protein
MVGDINQAIDIKSDAIEFYGHLFLILIVLVLPTLHIFATIEFLKPETIKKFNIKGIDANKLLLIILVLLIAISFYLKYYFINHIENAGYVYCEEKSRRTSFSKIYVFVRSNSECSER